MFCKLLGEKKPRFRPQRIALEWPPQKEYALIRQKTAECYLQELETTAFVDINIQSISTKLKRSIYMLFSSFGFSTKIKGDRVSLLKNKIHEYLETYIQEKKIDLSPEVKKHLAITDWKPLVAEQYLPKLETTAFVDIDITSITKKLEINHNKLYSPFGSSPRIKGDKVSLLKSKIHEYLEAYIKENKIELSSAARQNFYVIGNNFENEDIPAPHAGTARVSLKLNLSRPKIGWFEVKPVYIINGHSFSQEKIKLIVRAKQTQVYVDGVWVDIPLKIFNQLQKCLDKWARQNAEGGYTISAGGMAGLAGALDADSLEQEEVLQDIWAALHDVSSIKPVALPRGLKQSVEPYQAQGYHWLNFLYKHNFGGLLADEMGVGKTAQVLLLLAKLKQNKQLDKPALIVMPTTVLNWQTWEKEIEKFLPGQFKVLVVAGTQDERRAKLQEAANYDLVLTSYPLLRADRDSYAGQEFSAFILDEAHKIKNSNTGIAKIAKDPEIIKARWRLAVTGTPIENSIYDLQSILNFTLPGLLGRNKKDLWDEFKDNPDLLKQRIYPFIMRRLLKEVKTDLPQKILTNLTYTLSPAETHVYNGILKQKDAELKKLAPANKAGTTFGYIYALTQICNHPNMFPQHIFQRKDIPLLSSKFKLFCVTLDQILKNPQNKTVVFARSPKMLEIIAEYLQAQNIEYCHLYGSDSAQARETAINNFNENPQKRVFLCSITAGNNGIPLTAANNIIHYDLWWNSAMDDQARARVVRIGQTRKVRIYYFTAENTVEEKVLELQAYKDDIANKILSKDDLELGKEFSTEQWQGFFFETSRQRGPE